MVNCKVCGNTKLIKNGKNKLGAQRYKCKSCCAITFIEGDLRLKHGLKKRLKVTSMYLKAVGIRSIERLEKVSNPLITYLIRHFSELIRKELKRRPIYDKLQDVAIVEADKLFTYYKKRPKEHMYGLLLTETETRLLISK